MPNLYASLPEDLSTEVFDVLVRHEAVTIERIVSRGHRSPPSGWYDQAQHEWVVVLKGEAVLAFEDEEIRLTPGSHVDIPAHRRHRVAWTTPVTDTIWLAVHYGP
ncbi:cupin domain-containing protein [Halomonas beimenensis]|uniref:Cupin domain protein related to quercetin dioxygenase n=1 Tax=Halomonas beimenensis TaxID=475662 RepID=A0A291P454_9GAMM|nr:cupin domain-containing protein [Halomonas beimenensis]ATJ81683.1 cupin domain protein related to quercetin dioxygenase [Halomonas beimenensis]